MARQGRGLQDVVGKWQDGAALPFPAVQNRNKNKNQELVVLVKESFVKCTEWCR